MTARTTQPIEPTRPTRPPFRTSSSIDGFVLRRIQSAAKLKWENASNKSISQFERVAPTRTKSDRPRRQMKKCKSADATLERPSGNNRIMRGVPDFDWSQGFEALPGASKLKRTDQGDRSKTFEKTPSASAGPGTTRNLSRSRQLRRQASAASKAA